MNPAGLRIEEKKTAEGGTMVQRHYRQATPGASQPPAAASASRQQQQQQPALSSSSASPPEIRSSGSYKSTHSTRSSVLERAKEYNRRIDEQNLLRRRTKSLERGGGGGGSGAYGGDDSRSGAESSTAGGSSAYYNGGGGGGRQRSHSAGRVQPSSSSGGLVLGGGNRASTRERALASVRRGDGAFGHGKGGGGAGGAGNATSTRVMDMQPQAAAGMTDQYPLTPSTAYTSGSATTPHALTPPQPQQHPAHGNASKHRGTAAVAPAASHPPYHHQHPSASKNTVQSLSPTSRTTSSASSSQQPHDYRQHHQQQQLVQPQSRFSNKVAHPHHRPAANAGGNRGGDAAAAFSSSSHRPVPARHPSGEAERAQQQAHQQRQQQPPSRQQPSAQGGGGDHGDAGPALVTPELLVDALSGHEDGLLAIAERLMEHYDSGYDVMGEAIIDAFADVQKLFQHVVEAAHMEGAAFEATRAQEEILELKRQAATAAALGGGDPGDLVLLDGPGGAGAASPASPGVPARHDEFIDQDVKDILTEAIRKGSLLRDANKHTECYELYDRACQQASSLLPVDSDHRGRIQLSLARAESMTADRACAILRYAMDDVLRSGMRAVRTPLPDPSQRADVVLSRPMAHPSTSGPAAVVQSSDEALQSLIEELKEIISAPVYAGNASSPLQTVAKKFWAALAESQRMQRKNEERLEQQLGKLKGDYLLAKAEWEEKLNQANERTESLKAKYERLKESARTGNTSDYLDQSFSRGGGGGSHEDHDMSAMFTVKSTPSRSGSVASFGSGLAQQAKTLVSTMNNFNCTALNERTGVSTADLRDAEVHYEARSRLQQAHSSGSASSSQPLPSQQQQQRGRSTSAARRTPTRAFREYSKSPQRVDV